MYDWAAFPPTLLATAAGAVFAAGTSGFLAHRAKVNRHRELMSERLQAVIDALVVWNRIERPSKTRRPSMSMTYGAEWFSAWTEQRNDAKVAAASSVLLFQLEAKDGERPIANALKEAVRRVDHLPEATPKADAMTRINEALVKWWTGETSRSACVRKLDDIADGEAAAS